MKPFALPGGSLVMNLSIGAERRDPIRAEAGPRVSSSYRDVAP